EHADCDLNVAADHPVECRAVDLYHLDVLEHLGRGGTRQPLEHGDLAEEVPLFHDGELLLHASDLPENPHSAGLDHIHLVVQVAFFVDELPFPAAGDQVFEGVAGHEAIPLRTMKLHAHHARDDNGWSGGVSNLGARSIL